MMNQALCTTLAGEHAVLLRHLATVQRNCEAQLQRQADEIARLRAEAMKLRATIIARDSALAWTREDHAAMQADIPGLASRVTLARKVKALHCRLQDLMREQLRPPIAAPRRAPTASASTETNDDMSALAASIVAADLVICQTGCLSHGAYWRVEDHCKRSGKPCVLVEQPDKLRIVRIHRKEKQQQAGQPWQAEPVARIDS